MSLKDVFEWMEIESQSHDEGHLWLSVEEIVGIIEAHTGHMNVVLDPGAYMPVRAHDTDAGYDLRTPVRVYLHPHSTATIDTGVHIELPPGKCAVVVSKSGLNVHHDITSTGLIDEGFTGTIIIKLYNHGDRPHIFDPGDKISQFYITDYYGPKLEVVHHLAPTERGDGGYGSTGR